MNHFTKIGSDFARWEPLRKLAADVQLFWIALYTGPRVIPGLVRGGIGTLADNTGRTPLEADRALYHLIEERLVDFDPKANVLRFSVLPDCHEWPMNGKVVRGWWTRFIEVPQCGVRDAHVSTLWWLIERGSEMSRSHSGRRRGGVSEDHRTAWDQTFASITVPKGVALGVASLPSSDTSTPTQPSLFRPRDTVSRPSSAASAASPSPISPNKENQGSGYGIRYLPDPDTDPDTVMDPEGESVRGGLDRLQEAMDRFDRLIAMIANYAPERIRPVADTGPARMKTLAAGWLRTLDALDARELGDDELVVLAQYIATGAVGDLDVGWFTDPGRVTATIVQALLWRAQQRPPDN